MGTPKHGLIRRLEKSDPRRVAFEAMEPGDEPVSVRVGSHWYTVKTDRTWARQKPEYQS